MTCPSKWFKAAICAAGFILCPSTRFYAVDPPPDGGYPIRNTAEGEDALLSLTTGYNNTAVGFNALFANTTGFHNTAIGSHALLNNTKGVANTAIGLDAMKSTTIGKANVAFGVEALIDNIQGFRNIAIGTESLKKTTGSDNVGLGYEAGMNVTTGSSTICIGNMGLASDSNLIRIGTDAVQSATFMAGIKDTPIAGTPVAISPDGQLGATTSSARLKEAIKPMDKSSEAVLSLQPVSFRYRKEVDPAGVTQFGLVAEDVAKVEPDLVTRDKQGKPYTVRYDAVNAMLLNEFLKEHQAFQELKKAVAEQRKEIEKLKFDLKARSSMRQ